MTPELDELLDQIEIAEGNVALAQLDGDERAAIRHLAHLDQLRARAREITAQTK